MPAMQAQLGMPLWLDLATTDIDAAKRFYAEAEVDGRVWGHGEGRSKKQAEQAAAREAFERLVATVEDVGIDGVDPAVEAETSAPEPSTASRHDA